MWAFIGDSYLAESSTTAEDVNQVDNMQCELTYGLLQRRMDQCTCYESLSSFCLQWTIRMHSENEFQWQTGKLYDSAGAAE